MTDLNDIMKQAKQMQAQFQKAQEDMANLEIEGESGAGLVKVVLNGRHDVKDINISDAVMSEEKAVIEDLIAAAFNDAVRKLEDKNKQTLGGMAGGFKMPEGFKMPF